MISIEAFRGKSIIEHTIEIVERKGTGHPDYICDSLMEAISVSLSREYLKEFGVVLHHNIDKGLLAAGRVIKYFGGGRVIRPMELTIGDRATFRVGRRSLPIAEIAMTASKNWLRENLRFVDPDAHIKYRVVLAPGSTELTDIFKRKGKVLGANDTSAAVGYYPLSPTERVVLELERYINSKKFKSLYPETGEDVKVMGLRRGKRLDLTVAVPLMAEMIKSEVEYFDKKEEVLREILIYLERFSGDFHNIDVHINTLDERGRGLGGVYLSLLGTSAEDADSGQVGRGNRVNGLISMGRPMGTEAAAGKNPVSHVGKIYNVLSHKIAKKIYEKINNSDGGVKEVYVMLLSRIGTPIDRPLMASAQILLGKGRTLKEVSKIAHDIFETEISNIDRFCMELIEGKYPIC